MATPSTSNLNLPSAQTLQSTEQMNLLDAVDELRALGLGEFTALPQLIVCGDQSSGKSSVLEALSGVPFPRKDGVCTRFATEVILRRDRRTSMKISITPSEDLPVQEQERLQLFHHDIASKEDFANLFEKAKEAMGISDKKRSFSKSILRVEFRGPQQPQLTLVDLPGLIHARTGTQTKDDIQLVSDLVGKYLNNPRSIILAVVSARNDINNQIITEKVRDVDPQGKRALGIITKPDTVGPNEIEKWIKLARNEDVKFTLGWHVIKNLDLGTENASQETRDEQETDFFQNSSFSVLPSQNKGIATLRTRLSKVLFEQIQKTLPKLLEDIENRIRATKAARDRLGPSRSTTLQQRNYLIKISQSFYAICLGAIGGYYEHEFFKGDSNKSKRLCANLMNKHFEFANTMDEVGASWEIVDGDSDDADDSDEEIVDHAHRTRKQAIKEACKILKDTRGSELPGLSNPQLVGELFRDYSRPWEGIARDHIIQVWNATKVFLEIVLHYLTDDDVCDKILRFWLDPIMDERLEAANSKLNELLEVHKDYPMTLNHDFVANRRQIQRERNEQEPNISMDMVAAEEAFDNMTAYYKVAMKLFVDNVPTLAIRAPIIKKLPEMLSPDAVSTLMDDDIVTKIAGESEEKARERQEAIRTLDKLEEGARTCRKYAARPPSSDYLSAEGLGNVATQQSSAQRGAEKQKNRNTPSRQHSIFAPKPGDSSTSASTNTTGATGRSPFSSLNVFSDPRTFSGTSLFSATTSSAADPAIPSSASGFSGFGSKPTSPFSTGFGLGKTTGSESTSLFGGSGFGSTSASPPKKSTEARRRIDIFSPSDIEKMRLISTAPSTHIHCHNGFSPFEQPEPNAINDDMNHFQSITFLLPFKKYSFEELRLADYADGYRPELKERIKKKFPFAGDDEETLLELYDRFGLNSIA